MTIFNYRNVIVLCLGILTLSGCGIVDEETGSANNSLDEIIETIEEIDIKIYKEIVDELEEISITEINNIRSNLIGAESYYFYFGRESCPACREFAFKNKDLLNTLEKFYYIDTEDLPVGDREILEYFEITQIPAIIEITITDELIHADIAEFEKEINNVE